jgi:hypothetical protein
VSVVWLTAAATVIAATPYPVCACPGIPGRSVGASCPRCQHAPEKQKQNPAPASDKNNKHGAQTGAKSCCQPEPGQEPAQPDQGSAKKAGEIGLTVTTPDCVKSLARAEAFSPPDMPTTVNKDLSSGPALLSLAGVGSFSPLTTCFDASWEVGLLPGPPDLLTLCHRLLI